MKKIIALLIITLSLFGMGITSIASQTPDTLRIHYFRYDDNYTNFNMWIWQHEPDAMGGIQHDFDQTQIGDFGVYHDINLTEDYLDATTLGIIIKRGGWDGYREIGGDRFIHLEGIEVINGVAHAYFVEQDINIGKSNADLANNIPDYRAKILILAFDKQQRIVANLTDIPELGYEVFENDTLIMSGDAESKNLLITLPNVDISKTYSLKVIFDSTHYIERIVSLQNLFDTAAFEDLYTYTGELGVSFEDEFTIFRIWAPLSQSITLNLYNQGHPNYNDSGELSDELLPFRVEDFYQIENGAWEIKLTGDFNFKYYTFSVNNNGIVHEVVDPYAYSTGVNGIRGMIVDFSQTNPEGWTYGTRPNTITNLTDYIIYELHIRDLTSHESWNGYESYRGKFMGFTETGTTYTDDNGLTVSTGIDHISELGINAVHLLPIGDFGHVDEIEVALNPNYANVFNWGYMPYNFNTLEGSYSTNPFDGRVRIYEFKKLVMALHEKDIRVIMDVVYNHTGPSSTSNFHQIVPGYYHRLTEDGGFWNGSGTGNETASERSMMRKFMIDSVKFWTEEFNMSGFRFDLMALHDVQTMNEIQSLVSAIDPTIIIYGEPWTGATSPLDESIRADKENMADMNLVGAFNDVTRNAIKGSVFQITEQGWLQGNSNDYNVEGIKYGIMGGIDSGLGQIDEWHLNPNQTINYVTSHDNSSLHDKLRLTGVKSGNIQDLQIQANAIILTAQGIPFLHAGVEFMRSKPAVDGGFDHNSYESPDSVNQLRWDRKAQFNNVFEYYKTLIEIRKTYSHFRIDNADEILSRVTFLETNAGNEAVAFQIDGRTNEPDIIVIHSGHPSGGLTSVTLESGKSYKLLTFTEASDINGLEIVSGTMFVPANTTAILVEVIDAHITINMDTITVDKDAEFDPASNITINSLDAAIYYSSYHDTSIPGRYTITVAVVASYGKVTHYYYTLIVREYGFNITIDPNGIGG